VAMKITILFFGILRDITGENSIEFKIGGGENILELKNLLLKKFNSLDQYSNFSTAANEVYVEDNYLIKPNDIIALIPPVSGG
jgi:molybdopterin converting factor small subunit